MTLLDRIRRTFHDDETHFVKLVELFFRRFFDNELISQGSEARLTVVNVLALLALPPIIYTFYLIPIYDNIWWYYPWQYAGVSLIDHCRFITFSMVIIGFVAVLEWDALFPDQRDYIILTSLPLKSATIFAAKITALLVFLSLFAIDVAGVPTLLYPAVETMGIRAHVSLLHLCGLVIAHAAAIAAASAFSFLLFVAIQGVLINLFSPRLFKKISLYVQILAMVMLLLLLFLLPVVSALLLKWQKSHGAWLLGLPPLWFLGLYQTLLGPGDPGFHSLTLISILALAIVILACGAGYVLNYRRQMQRALDVPQVDPAGPSWLARAEMRLANQIVLRKPLERATFYFVMRTIARNAKHRLYFAAYAGIGLALALLGILEALVHSSREDFVVVLTQPHEALLAIPLIVSFFLLSGMRMVLTIPAELRANWVFQLAEDENRADSLTGTRKAMIAPVILTLAALSPLYAALWGWQPAFMHLSLCLVLSLILVEILLLSFRKVPFTCSFQPGKANITVRGVFYWFAFTIYAYTMATLERWLLQDGVRWVAFMVVAVFAFVALARWRHESTAQRFNMVYDDAPDPEVQTLGLGA